MKHLYLHIIDSMVYLKTIHRLDVFTPKEFDHLYNRCANGKSHHLPLSGSSASQYSKIELLIMDLTGPMSVPTWDGYLYVLVVVEVSCCYAVGYLLKEKEETSIAIQDIMAIMEYQSSLKAHQLWSDNSFEFVNKIIEQFCQLNSIIHETTISYLLEQTRIAEQSIAIFFKLVYCMLWSTGVELQYWEKGFMYTVFIRNIILISSLK